MMIDFWAFEERARDRQAMLRQMLEREAEIKRLTRDTRPRRLESLLARVGNLLISTGTWLNQRYASTGHMTGRGLSEADLS